MSLISEREERVGEEGGISVRNIDQLLPSSALTRDQTHNLGFCPEQESNLQTFGVWDGTVLPPSDPPSQGSR